jgi:hypothetical protein
MFLLILVLSDRCDLYGLLGIAMLSPPLSLQVQLVFDGAYK